MYYQTTYASPVGNLTLGSDGNALIGVWMEGQKYFGGSVSSELLQKDDLPIFGIVKEWLDRYFAGKQPKITELSLDPVGGAFRQQVWELLCEIPYGAVTTYGALAKKMAEKMGKASMSSQAIGGAVGHNPISIIIPCHRVVGSDGSLTGYAGGIDTKIKLLEHEGVDMSGLYVPKIKNLSGNK